MTMSMLAAYIYSRQRTGESQGMGTETPMDCLEGHQIILISNEHHVLEKRWIAKTPSVLCLGEIYTFGGTIKRSIIEPKSAWGHTPEEAIENLRNELKSCKDEYELYTGSQRLVFQGSCTE